MKKIVTFLSLLTLASFNANSQIKTADISVVVTNPATSTVTVPAGDTLFVSFQFTNNGPDALVAGDSVFFYSGGIVLFSNLLQSFPVGATMNMDNILYFYNPTDSTLTGEICVLHLRQAGVTYENGTNPVTTYQDTVYTNDTSCFEVTLLGNTTSINGLVAGKLQFELSPNPAIDFIDVTNLTEDGTIEFSIINSLGQTVLSEKQEAKNKKTRISIKELPSGNYYIVQIANGRKVSSNFVIKH